MIEFVKIILVIWGIFASSGEGMILDRPASWMRERLPMWLCKPLFDCHICMASIWGTYGYIFFIGENYINLIWYIPALAGANYLINEIISMDSK